MPGSPEHNRSLYKKITNKKIGLKESEWSAAHEFREKIPIAARGFTRHALAEIAHCMLHFISSASDKSLNT